MQISQVAVYSAGYHLVNGIYKIKKPNIIPAGFDRTCQAMNWDTNQMWKRLSDGERPWFENENESYIYWNRGDGKWWMDGPSGSGVYIVKSNDRLPPRMGWVSLGSGSEYNPSPVVELKVDDDTQEL
mmetsp:Transcript_8575/g.11342  ORF Transcript_8575/g.11342 Transcript_8575/m.11342 type:complete len:127 (-) Transcript_8575:184-564(-)